MKNKIAFIVAVIFLSSCVSLKQYNDSQEKMKKSIAENEQLKKEKIDLEAVNSGLADKNKQLESKLKSVEKELDDAKYSVKIQKERVVATEKEIADLQRQLDVLNSGSSTEIENLLKELNETREDLNIREDKLREAEKELESRNAKLIELQQILARKDEAVKDLKNKVMNALTGFNNKGLTVHEKNGKVYVSLDEKLLFKTGKWDVDPNGQKALKELSKVLAQNPDINIMVEGHTDNVPMRGSGEVKDNWDLSVMRATAVTKILMAGNDIDPVRIIAAGRSEYLPLSAEQTAEGRQMNRRTEIILTPNIDELLKIIEMN
ncbi:MAG: OmpA family protein [Draconibacterium sp.]